MFNNWVTTTIRLGGLTLSVDTDKRSGLGVFNAHDRIGILHLDEKTWRSVVAAMKHQERTAAVVAAAREWFAAYDIRHWPADAGEFERAIARRRKAHDALLAATKAIDAGGDK